MRPAKPSLAVAATLAAAVLWGTSFSVNDIGLGHVGPATFVFFRFALAGALVLGALALVGRAQPSLVREPIVWGLALANASGFLLQYVGQTMTTPARTALFVNTSAFAVAVLERWLYRRRLGALRWLLVAVGVGGAVVLVVGSDPELLRGGRLLGDLLTLGSGLLWSVFVVLNARAVETREPVALTAWIFALTALLLAPALLVQPEPFAIDRTGALAILYAGVVTTAIAYALWTYGLTGVTATASAVLLLVEILVASLLSLSLGRETFGWIELVGAALICAGVVGMSVVGAKKETAPAPA